jgi:hypothetical protein
MRCAQPCPSSQQDPFRDVRRFHPLFHGVHSLGSFHSSELWKERVSPPLRKLSEGPCQQGHCLIIQ